MSDPRDEIAALHGEWSEAVKREDIDRIASLLTEDYELWAPGSPPIRGREAVRAMMAAAFGRFGVDSSYESEECLVSGDLAVDRGWDTQTVVPRGGGESRSHRQRVFLVLRRGADGRWQYARGMSQPGPGPE